MDVKKYLCRIVREKPETLRASRKGVTVDFSKLVRMGFNENVFGMSPKAIRAMQDAAPVSNTYMDWAALELKKTIAGHYGVDISNIVTSAGSSVLIDMIGQAFLEPGDEVLFCMPTFAAFIDMAQSNGATPVTIPLNDDMTYDIDGLLAAINDRTKVVVICNPNNPTGTYVGAAKLREFIEKVPEHVITVFDEAYIEFAEAEDCISMVDDAMKVTDKPIIVMKTFSKFYGMAGVRVGYVITQPEVAAEMNKLSGAYNVSKMAQAGAAEAMKDTEHGAWVKEQVLKCRHYLQDELRNMGCTVYTSQTNFIYFDAHRPAQDVVQALIQKGIFTSFQGINRVSVGKMDECESFIKGMREILGK